jgi:hypothetical protein
VGEAFCLRHSLCCGRRGCRKRSTPPSVRFLGRRVYLGVVVLIASFWAHGLSALKEALPITGVPARTLERWGGWWREQLPRLPVWFDLRARFVPPPPTEAALPWSLVNRVRAELQADLTDKGETTSEAVALFIARCLAPATTNSVADGSRFLRDLPVRRGSEVRTQRM